MARPAGLGPPKEPVGSRQACLDFLGPSLASAPPPPSTHAPEVAQGSPGEVGKAPSPQSLLSLFSTPTSTS